MLRSLNISPWTKSFAAESGLLRDKKLGGEARKIKLREGKKEVREPDEENDELKSKNTIFRNSENFHF